MKKIKMLVAILAAVGMTASFQVSAKDKDDKKTGQEQAAEMNKGKQGEEMKAEHAKADMEKEEKDKAEKAEEKSMKQKAMEKKKDK